MTVEGRPAAPRRLRSTLVGMFNVGGGELLVIMLIALIVLGPQRLPDAAKQVGRVMGDLRRISSGFQQELKDAFDTDDAPTPLRRKESVPLASTVAKADREADSAPRRDAPTEADDAPAADGATTSDAGDAGGATVAPAVAAALDEIVTPLDAHATPSAPAEPAPRRDAHADAQAAPAADHATAHGVGATGDHDAAGTTVAPAVAAALDEIVAPLDAHAAPSPPAEPAGPPVAEPTGSAPSPADGGDALGDERAAS